MSKHFQSKRKLRKKWLMECVFLLLFTYFLIKFCIYSLVDMSPASYLQLETIGQEFWNSLKEQTINTPVQLLNYRVAFKKAIHVLPTSKVEQPKKRIYIYSTHDTEAYDSDKNILDASADFKQALEKQNIEVTLEQGSIHDFLIANNYQYRDSYIASRYFITAELEKNQYDLIIDLHRDAASRSASTVSIEDKEYAKVLFVIGKKNEQYEKNYQVAKEINDILKEKYPTISRGILLQSGENVNGVYNQDLDANMILIELGGNKNHYEEVSHTIDVLAEILGEYFYGEKI